MRENSFDREVKRRIDRLSRALREYGLVDRYGLGDLMRSENLPRQSAIVRALNARSETLPPGVSPRIVAAHVLSFLEGAEDHRHTDNALPELLERLSDLTPGSQDAHDFHEAAFEILKRVFHPHLRRGRIQQRQYGGKKIIDILFANEATKGFFAEGIKRYDIEAPLVLVECKNYVEDPTNPELDQLSGRLNHEVGQLGILVCRSVGDRDRMWARCADYRKKSEYLLWLEDADLSDLADHSVANRDDLVQDWLSERLERLMLQ